MRILLIGLSAAVLWGCGGNTPTADEPVSDEPVPGGDIIVGGYGSADPDDPFYAAARERAIEEVHARYPTRALVDTVSLEVQVVAGLNHRFRIEMTGAPEVRAIYNVTVYQSLDGELEVTAFDKIQ